jgi:hypothetical protein
MTMRRPWVGMASFVAVLSLAALSFGRPIFRPSVHTGANECGSFAPVLLLFALRRSSRRVLHLDPLPRGRSGRASQDASRDLIKGHYCFHQDNDDSKCEGAHTSLPIRSSKSPARYRSREGYMAPKPEPAGLASVFGTLTSVFGIVLAVAAILAVWRGRTAIWLSRSRRKRFTSPNI